MDLSHHQGRLKQVLILKLLLRLTCYTSGLKSAILMILRVREPLLGAKNCTQFNDPKVHFAATKGALSLYFAKCGSVVNMVTLTDEATS
ncbi:hypothetical protein CIPAW_16G077800 [Carya illinoinensis]|uniref:Uncharacterized protein n=1 Tax=Carya illinoinensis TaxID=32201 RepID=A0A8T1N6U7_CARIL|nr:hypothetical protein CIPAW_16G077800 [Carya illinoinensis]